MLELQPDGQWPLWSGASHEDGYGHIAAFVTPSLVEHHLPPVYRRAGGLLASSSAGLGVIRALWRVLVDKEFRYAEPAWDPSEGQRIRDSQWLLRHRDRGAGNCVDLSLLFAAQCLNEGLDTYLVMLRGSRTAHVMVAVRPGQAAVRTEDEARVKDESQLPAGTTSTDVPGVLRISDREALIADHNVLLIDVATATAENPDRSLEAAIASGREILLTAAFEHADLVDVAVRQELCGDTPLRPPWTRGALRARITPPALAVDFASEERARQVLLVPSGKIVVTGPQGAGMSTLARKAAALYDGGFGWFLNASSRMAFDTALAEHELFERGAKAVALEAVEREGLARDALDRLRHTKDRWVIVIDNANTGAKVFDAARYAVDRLPVPRDGQLIIATSTAAPEQWPGWIPVTLSAVPVGQLTAFGDPQAAELSAGWPLLWAAFTSLFSFAPTARELVGAGRDPHSGSLASPRDDDHSARHAAALYWRLARQYLNPLALGCAERMAWMPPDRIEPGVAGDDKAIRGVLTQVGLLSSSGSPDAVVMHRMFGEAIRAAVTAEGRAEATVRDLLARPEARTSLLRYSDAEVTAEQAVALATTRSGLALWALATLQEPYGGKSALETFARARGMLDPPVNQAERSALADCLHAAARAVNQQRDGAEAGLHAAIADAQRAVELRDPAEQVAIARHEAILALLRQRAVRFVDDPAEKVRELQTVLELLEHSWERRRDALGPDDPLVDRAQYNLASVRMSLARLDAANASVHLAAAGEAYEATLAFRRRYYNGSNPITAASLNGIGILGFEVIRLGLADDPYAVFAKAFDAVTEALAMRRESGIAPDIEKSAILLSKLAVLQVKVATATPGAPDGHAAAAMAEVARDLGLTAAGDRAPERTVAAREHADRPGSHLTAEQPDIAELTAEAMPCAAAALGAYGMAVLAKTRDELPDATIGTGRRLLQKIFGQREEGEGLPGVLAKVVKNPGDEGFRNTLKLAIGAALGSDDLLQEEVREIITAAHPLVTAAKQFAAGRDAVIAGRDITITRPGS